MYLPSFFRITEGTGLRPCVSFSHKEHKVAEQLLAKT